MVDLTITEMQARGAIISGDTMPNGEDRWRLEREGFGGYTMTIPPGNQKPGWQEPHYHKGLFETFVVQDGCMAVALLCENGAQTVELFGPNTTYTTRLNQQHNIYLFSGTLIHTVKHGNPIGNPLKKSKKDWYDADPEFAAWSKGLSEDKIMELASN